MPIKLFGKIGSALRGDKYLVGAYPPEWHSEAAAHPAGDASPGPNTDVVSAPGAQPAETALAGR